MTERKTGAVPVEPLPLDQTRVHEASSSEDFAALFELAKVRANQYTPFDILPSAVRMRKDLERRSLHSLLFYNQLGQPVGSFAYGDMFETTTTIVETVELKHILLLRDLQTSPDEVAIGKVPMAEVQMLINGLERFFGDKSTADHYREDAIVWLPRWAKRATTLEAALRIVKFNHSLEVEDGMTIKIPPREETVGLDRFDLRRGDYMTYLHEGKYEAILAGRSR